MAKQRNPQARPIWQPRFGTRGLFLLMLVVSVMAAGGYYLVESLRGGRRVQLTFIIFTIAAPMLVLVAVSVAKYFLDGSGRRK